MSGYDEKDNVNASKHNGDCPLLTPPPPTSSVASQILCRPYCSPGSVRVMQLSTRAHCSIRLGVDVDLGGAATMPGSKEHTAATALVLDVLEGVHNVGNAAQAEEAAETESPGMCSVSHLIRNVCHCSLSARGAIRWGRSTSQACDWRRVLVDGAALLLGWHTGLLHVAGLLMLHVRALRLLRRRCADILLLRWWRTDVLLLRLLSVHGLLLWLLLVHHVGVLVVDRRLLLARHVWRLGVLLHWDTLLLHCERMYCLMY